MKWARRRVKGWKVSEEDEFQEARRKERKSESPVYLINVKYISMYIARSNCIQMTRGFQESTAGDESRRFFFFLSFPFFFFLSFFFLI